MNERVRFSKAGEGDGIFDPVGQDQILMDEYIVRRLIVLDISQKNIKTP
jgi:hypothetical protein